MTGNKTLQKQILSWYDQNKRALPWRKNQDPYPVWISEIMLQQTTVQAVIPFYERFLEKFPSIEALAQAPEKDVLEHWSGLGYYSRARNIHRAAKLIAQQGFPKKHEELIKLPGFGPYTARAVTSIAFNENVGVVDGNVIRVLSRLHGEKVEWWKTSGRKKIQTWADHLVEGVIAGDVNQALMDLGSMLCTPTSPTCVLCPWRCFCQGLKAGSPETLPLKKPKRPREIWHWKVNVVIERGRLAMTQQPYTPFLKGQWMPPGRATQKTKPPEKYHFKHSITHHDIFIEVSPKSKKEFQKKEYNPLKWVLIKDIKAYNPTSLIDKVLKQC